MPEVEISDTGGHSPRRLREGQEGPGGDMSRIVSLSDGVFAFAMTLLVLSLTVPAIAGGLTAGQLNGMLGASLWHDWQGFIGYVFAFVMIAVWWTAHHRLFQYIVRYDDVLVNLNLAMLLEIAVMPFALRIYTLYSNTEVAVVLFAVVEMATGLTLNLLWRYASANHRLVTEHLSDTAIRAIRLRGLFTPIVFAISIPVAFVSISAAQYIWVGVFVAQALGRRAMDNRERQRHPAQTLL
ncbi:MAG: TMEM175 family protein [Thermoplasmata archaeon]